MKVQELRIGNLVTLKGRTLKVESIDETGVNYSWFREGTEYDGLFDSIYGESIEPIPLTEQVLLDFGLDKLGENYWGIEHFKISFQQDKFWYLFENYSVDFNIPDIEINSLHHLQNLYYALTGTELTYQPRPI